MRHICLFLFSFLLCKASFAKEPVNANPGTDTAAIIRLFHTGDTILNADSAIVFCNRILKLSEEANYANGAFAALMSKGIKYSEKEDFVTSRDCYLQAMQYAPKANRKDAVAWCYNNIGTTYASEGDYTLASQYFYNTLQEFKKTGAPPTSALVNAYNNLAAINMRLNQVDKAFSYYNQAEEIARKGKFNFQLASILLDKGLYCISIHKPDSALMYFNEVMDIGKNINKVDLQATANLDIGQTFIEMGKYEKAIPYLRQSIALAENRFYETVLGAKYVLGDAYYRMRKYKDAETILLSVIKEMTSHNLKDMYLDGYGKLISVYKATGQYKKALDYTDTLAILKDSLTSTEKTKAINLMDVKYKTAEKDKEIAQNQLLIAQQKK